MTGEMVQHRETIATVIRIGSPANWKATGIRDASQGKFAAVSAQEILDADRRLTAEAAIFREPPASASQTQPFITARTRLRVV